MFESSFGHCGLLQHSTLCLSYLTVTPNSPEAIKLVVIEVNFQGSNIKCSSFSESSLHRALCLVSLSLHKCCSGWKGWLCPSIRNSSFYVSQLKNQN